ncbi:MAG: hypothetical protein WCS37_19890 [Chloroflexota bacterium]
MSNDNRKPPVGQEPDYEEEYDEEAEEEENRIIAKQRNVIKIPLRKPQLRNRVAAQPPVKNYRPTTTQPRNDNNVTAQAGNVTEAQPEQDYAAILANLERNKPLIAKPNSESEGSFANLMAWGGVLVINPVSHFFDMFDNAGQTDTPEYMSLAKKMMYRLGGALIWGWSAFLTQAITRRVFPDMNAVTKEGESFFQAGWLGFLNISLKAFVTSLIFTLMLSFIETLLFDKNKGPFKKLVIALAFLLDLGINTAGWIELFNHAKYFQWNPLWTLLDAKNPRIEYGSLFCVFAALLTATLPEMLWHKARNGVISHKQYAKVTGRQNQERGAWLRNAQGQKYWVDEAELRKLAAGQRRAASKAQGGR